MTLHVGFIAERERLAVCDSNRYFTIGAEYLNLRDWTSQYLND
jgi:hypothetical protein